MPFFVVFRAKWADSRRAIWDLGCGGEKRGVWGELLWEICARERQRWSFVLWCLLLVGCRVARAVSEWRARRAADLWRVREAATLQVNPLESETGTHSLLGLHCARLRNAVFAEGSKVTLPGRTRLQASKPPTYSSTGAGARFRGVGWENLHTWVTSWALCLWIARREVQVRIDNPRAPNVASVVKA